MRKAQQLQNWLLHVFEELKSLHKTEITIVSLIGRDTFERRKTEDLNDFFRESIFQSSFDVTTELSIEAFFSMEYRTVFLALNGFSDVTQIMHIFEEESSKPFFEKIQDAEKTQLQLLLFISLVSHVILFVEQGCRLDVGLARTLKLVNKLRLEHTDNIIRSLPDDLLESMHKFEKEGRFSLPRFAFAFHRNTIRQDIGNLKKREIFDKLEQNLEQQIFNLFKMMRLIDTKEPDASLGYVPEKKPYAQLIPTKNFDPVTEAFLILVGEKGDEDELYPDSHKQNVMYSYISSLIDAVRADRSNVYMRPTLIEFAKISESLYNIIFDPKAQLRNTLKKFVTIETNFIESLSKKHLTEAMGIYSAIKEKDRRLLTKSEHDKRFVAVVNYLESVAIGNPEELIAKVSEECAGRWEKGCEAISLTGVPCQLTAHISPGDSTSDSFKWQPHSSPARYVSTCGCGYRQSIREDPFSLKEANYDFYHLNPVFVCCKSLETHRFKLLEEKGIDETEADTEEGQWTAAQPEPRLLLARRETRTPTGDESASDEDEELDEKSRASSEQDISIPRNSTLSPVEEPSSEDEDPTIEAIYLDDSDDSVTVNKKHGELIVEYEERRNLLKRKNVHFCDGVPHTRLSGLPMFPSFQLTCLGRSSVYRHQYGLREMPGFKPGADYLLPLDVHLEVDSATWSRDMNYVQELVSTSDMGRARIRRQRHGTNIEKVKLFIGFEYECPRGHRMFLGPDLEQLVIAKGSAKELVSKEAASKLLGQDMPLWKQCTCRKAPLVNAQLMRIHVVTPKAPVVVTIDPKIQPSSKDDGHFHTGEGPLELSWARYYILRLPFTYSGPNGCILPPEEIGVHGKFQANCITVTYTPLSSWI